MSGKSTPPSELYARAREALGSAKADWDQTAEQMERVDGPDVKNQSGSDAVRMIRTEQQLSDDPKSAAPELMKLLLACLASVRWPNDPMAFAQAYGNVMGIFALLGQPIRFSPDALYRYCNGPGLLRAVSDALRTTRPNFAQRLDQLIHAAASGTAGVSWDTVMDFVTTSEVWHAIPLDEVPLSRAASTFVTFDASQPAKRESARWMHSALALWKPVTECFLESQYGTDHAGDLRYPTLADAGWFRYFRSAEPTEPHGWTNPHDAALPPQPEAVHGSGSLGALQSADDLRVLSP